MDIKMKKTITTITLAMSLLLSTASFAVSNQLSPQKVLLAQKLSAIDGSKEALISANKFAIQQFKSSMPSDTPAEFYTKLNQYSNLDNTHLQTSRATALILSEAELKKMIEFYQSTEGKSIAQKMPQLTYEMSVISTTAIEQALIQTIEELESKPR